ncbi:MAG: HlyD family type I secretion periplasmic adaptor subunit [Rhodospirillales bacterium]
MSRTSFGKRPALAPETGRQDRPGAAAQPDNTPRAVAVPDNTLDSVLGRWRRRGWAVIIIFIGGSVVWAANTRLDSAAIARGVVGVESSRKTIQHLEGGIIKNILTNEGDRIKAGQILVQFDDTYARAQLDLLQGRYAAALAQQARLLAEREGREDIDFPDELLGRANDPVIAEMIAGQKDLFQARRIKMANEESILRERIAKHRQEITGLRAQVVAGKEHLRLLKDEIATVKSMLEKGVASKSVLLALQRQAADMEGEIGDHRARIALAERSIMEVKLQLTIPGTESRNEVAKALQEVQGEVADLKEKIYAAEDVLLRTGVRAPQSGTVVDLQVHTAGGVVQPGETLLDIVPDEDRLIIDVRVDPQDIDTVYEGMPARARITAFNRRTTPLLEGSVTSVSADRMTDPVTGQSYFTARVVPAAGTQGFDVSTLKPGMQAEVFLVTAERTALDYLLQPIARSFARAGREQ